MHTGIHALTTDMIPVDVCYRDGEMKINTNGLCHMTKMAAMPIYGKNLLTSSALEPKGRWPWNF